MVALLIMHTESDVFTDRIFTIRFTGIAGITTLSSMIRFIIPHGIRPIIAGDGEATGIHPIIAGDGDIHLITVTGTGHIMAGSTGVIMADILTIAGMDTGIADILIQKITATDKDVQPDPVFFTVMRMEEEQLPLVYGQQPQPPKARRKGLELRQEELSTMHAAQVPVPG